MKETEQELLSRILDEDVSEFETQRILKEMQTDDGLRTKLQRYSLIGSAIRKELPKQINPNFVHNVMSKLDDEQISMPSAGSEHGDGIAIEKDADVQGGRFKTALGLAIAASVAVVSFVSFQNYVQNNNESVQQEVLAERVIEEKDIQRVSSHDMQNFISTPEAAASFNSYIMNHAEYASPRVSVPHVRIVGYGKEEVNSSK